jgi:PAS domain S-box-containing protein
MPSDAHDDVVVLAVTPDEAYAEEMSRNLADQGAFRIETTRTVEDALDRLGSGRAVDCIVSDHDLPTLDGVAFLATVRAQDPTLPFVLFTDAGSEAVASRAISAGVTDYLIKERHGDEWARLATLIDDAVAYQRARGEFVDPERRARTLLDAAHDTIAIVRDGEYAYVNESGVDLFGVPNREALYRTPVSETLVAAAGDPSPIDAEALTGEGRVDVADARVVGPDGSLSPVELSATRIEWFGSPATVLVVRDVSDREASKRRLRRFNRAVEAAGHGIYITDVDGTIQYVNPAFEEITGYAAEAALGRTPRILQSGEHDDDYYERLWETIRAGDVWEEKVVDRRASGDLYHAHQTIAPILDDEGGVDAFVAIQTDITEQRERAERLREYERAVEATNDLVAAVDTDYRYLFANQRYREYHGVDGDDLSGAPLAETIDPSTWAEIRPHLERALAGDVVRYRTTRERADRPDRTFDVRYHPLRDDETGEIRGVVGTMRDVTEREERERQLDVLGRVLRHNLHNAMNVVLGNARMIADESDGADAECAEQILSAGESLLELTDKQRHVTELLSEPRRVRSFEITVLIRRAVEQVRDDHPEATIDLSLPASVDVETIPELTQAVVELVENAIEHGGTDTRIEVSATTGPETVVIAVADEGPGIPAQERTVLTGEDDVDPLYHGSGMGLWLVNWIVTRSEGTLTFEENDPRGSVVKLTLPRTLPRTTPSAAPAVDGGVRDAAGDP